MAYHVIAMLSWSEQIIVADKALWLTWQVEDMPSYLKTGNSWKDDIVHFCSQDIKVSFKTQKLWLTLVICIKYVVDRILVRSWKIPQKNEHFFGSNKAPKWSHKYLLGTKKQTPAFYGGDWSSFKVSNDIHLAFQM